MLGRRGKHLRICDDILRNIADGRLLPGDQLASLADLRKQYRAGQKLVTRALSELTDLGVVEVRRRQGSFITREAPEIARAELEAQGGSAPASASPSTDEMSASSFSAYIRPVEHTRPLTVYLTEMLPENLAVWRETLEHVRNRLGLAEPVRMLTCMDGHIQRIAEEHAVDLVQTTPLMLKRIGYDRFMPLPDAAVYGVDSSDLLPVVRERLTAEPDRPFAPFAVIPYLHYVNAAFGPVPDGASPASIVDIIRECRKREPVLRESGVHAMTASGYLSDYLMMAGALSFDADETPRLDEETAEALFDALYGAGFAPADPMTSLDRFIAGDLATLHHGMFAVMQFAAAPELDWRAAPIPMIDSGAYPMEFMVLAVARETSRPGDCLEIVRAMLSEETQKRFADLHGNPSVFRRVAESGAYLDEHPAGGDVVAAQLARSRIFHDDEAAAVLLQRCAMRQEESLLSSGAMTPAEALGRLRLYFSSALEQRKSTVDQLVPTNAGERPPRR